jgi:hypothetical protein
MSVLYGSKRTAERATLTPIRRRRRNLDRPEGDRGRAWEKWSYFSALSPSAAELAKIADRLPNATDADRRHLRRLAELTAEPGNLPRVSLALDNVRHFTELPDNLLERVGSALATLRSEVRDEALAAQKELLQMHTRQSSEPPSDDPATGEEVIVPDGYELDPTFIDPTLPGYRMYRLRAARPAIERLSAIDRPNSADNPDSGRDHEAHPGGNGGHCYRQMKDFVVNDKVPLGSLQRAEGLL